MSEEIAKSLLNLGDSGDHFALIWNKETGRFRGVAYFVNGDPTYKEWTDWHPLSEFLNKKDIGSADFTQTENVELIHNFNNSVCYIHINCNCIKIC